MRILLFALTISAATTAIASRAQAENYPWCAVLNMGDAAYNCGFVSREQCMASVSGIGGFCQVNTLYQPSAPAMQRTPRPYGH